MSTLFFLKISQKRQAFVTDIISSLLLLLFLYTGLSKLINHRTFAFVLSQSPLLHPFSGLLAIVLPLLEIVIAVMLFLPVTRLKAMYASFVLMLLLTVYLSGMVAFTHDLPCNCGGVIQKLSWQQHIVFNLFFLFLSFSGIFFLRRRMSRRSTTPP